MCSGRSRSSHTNPRVKTKAWKTYCLLCAGQGPSTDPVQNQQSKQSMGNMCTFVCSDPGPCTNPKVCSAQNPLAKKQGLENLPCFLCPGQSPHTDPNVCSAQNPLSQKTRIGKLTLFLVSWSRSTHRSKGIPCTNSVVRTWRVLRSGITSGTYRNSSPCSKFLFEQNKGLDRVYSCLFLFTWFYEVFILMKWVKLYQYLLFLLFYLFIICQRQTV